MYTLHVHRVFLFRTLTCTCIHLGPATMQAPLTGRQFMSSHVHTTEESCVTGLLALIMGCNTLQHTATHCHTLPHTATHCNTLLVMGCNTLQHTATHCSSRVAQAAVTRHHRHMSPFDSPTRVIDIKRDAHRSATPGTTPFRLGLLWTPPYVALLKHRPLSPYVSPHIFSVLGM